MNQQQQCDICRGLWGLPPTVKITMVGAPGDGNGKKLTQIWCKECLRNLIEAMRYKGMTIIDKRKKGSK